MDDEETFEQQEHEDEVEPADVFDRVRARGVTVLDDEDDDEVEDEDDEDEEPIEDVPASKFRFSIGDFVGELAESSSLVKLLVAPSRIDDGLLSVFLGVCLLLNELNEDLSVAVDELLLLVSILFSMFTLWAT